MVGRLKAAAISADGRGPRPRPRPRLLLLHIPKTAGTSVGDWVRTHFDEDDCLFAAHLPSRRGIDPNGYRFVQGHVDFRYVDRFLVRPFVFTFLRDPLERALSAYYFYRGHGPEKQARLLAYAGPKAGRHRIATIRRMQRTDLRGFLRDHPADAREVLGNLQTRFLAGHGGPPGAEQIDRALANLERSSFVGFVERMEESLRRLARHLGWTPPEWVPHVNPTAERCRVADLDRGTRAALARLTRLDAELYRRTRERFERDPALAADAERWLDDPLPDGRDFTFDRAIRGEGWLPREQTRDGEFYCWIGADGDAWLDVAADGHGDHRLEIDVAYVVRRDQLDRTTIDVNGVPVEAAIRRGRIARLVADVPERAIARDRRRLRIRIRNRQTLRPCDVLAWSSDPRRLGIALRRIRLRPASR